MADVETNPYAAPEEETSQPPLERFNEVDETSLLFVLLTVVFVGLVLFGLTAAVVFR